MRTTPFRTALFFLPFSIVAVEAAPIQNLTFTEVIKDVFVIDPATKKESPAKAGDKLLPPNVLKTGADSRAELVAEDKTVTRVGANTIFSVEANSRDVNLAQGSVLLHTPSGRGGGRIKSAGATASVLGTTLAVSANPDGGFKTSLLEGKGEVKDPKGGKVGLVAGQVTFARPGGGLSPALNFDLKAQISNSKLVGGFSTPIASIAKIEAAVAVQQAKIAGGGLVSTGMLIGDRPDTAFKVDSTIVDGQIRQAQTRRIEQERAAKETQTFYRVDPRFLEFVLDDTRNSLLLKSSGQDTSELFFYIDNTGRAILQQFQSAIGGVPKNLPSWTTYQEGKTSPYEYYAIIQKDITLELNVGAASSEKFLAVALDPDPNRPDSGKPDLSIVKKSGGLVAFENVKIDGNIDFYNLDNVETTPAGVDVGLALLISAGRTVQIEEGSSIYTKAAQLEIFAGGTSFSRDLDLIQRPLKVGERVVPLTLSAVSITSESEASSGLMRISAPEIRMTNTLLKATSGATTEENFSEIAINASGPVSISTDLKLLTAFREKTAANKTSLPLGFEQIEDRFRFIAFKIGIESKSDTLDISSVDLEANRVSLSSGNELRLTSVLLKNPVDPLLDVVFEASAVNGITIDSGIPNGRTQTAGGLEFGKNTWFSTESATKTTVVSKQGSISIQNTLFGSERLVSDVEKGNAPFLTDLASSAVEFTAKAAKQLLLTNSAVSADTVVFDGMSVEIKGVTVVPNEYTTESSISVTSASDLKVSGNSTFVAYQITFDAKNDMVLSNAKGEERRLVVGDRFEATATRNLDISGVNVGFARNVALEANTVILADVHFDGSSAVSLKSGAGVLSTPADRNGITKGWVNVLPNVKYGNQYDLHDLKNQMQAYGKVTDVSDPSYGKPPGVSAPVQTVGIRGGQDLADAIKAQFKTALPITVGKK
jgi:hypothetical protein